jgi:hypothetical protein
MTGCKHFLNEEAFGQSKSSEERTGIQATQKIVPQQTLNSAMLHNYDAH